MTDACLDNPSLSGPPARTSGLVLLPALPLSTLGTWESPGTHEKPALFSTYSRAPTSLYSHHIPITSAVSALDVSPHLHSSRPTLGIRTAGLGLHADGPLPALVHSPSSPDSVLASPITPTTTQHFQAYELHPPHRSNDFEPYTPAPSVSNSSYPLPNPTRRKRSCNTSPRKRASKKTEKLRDAVSEATKSILAALAGLSVTDKWKAIVAALRPSRMSPLDLALEILDPERLHYQSYRQMAFVPDTTSGRDKIDDLLLFLSQNPLGMAKLDEIARNRAVDIACKLISDEMDEMKAELNHKCTDITPSFLRNWSLETCVAIPARAKAPNLVRILESAASTDRAKENNKVKRAEENVLFVIGQLASMRSRQSLMFTAPLALFFYRNMVPMQVFDLLNMFGLSVCYKTTQELVKSLSEQCMNDARKAAQHFPGMMLGYDNINMSTSIFVEQVPGAPAKVQSGTFPILYSLRTTTTTSPQLAPLLIAARSAPALEYHRDLTPSNKTLRSILQHFKQHIIRVLVNFSPHFKHFESSGDLKHESSQSLPTGYISQQFPLQISTFNEATVKGNIAVIEDIYLLSMISLQMRESVVRGPCVRAT
ncbi:hypothetical protein ONZ45_g18717 [Pleurotus djamor]|nr:hypothetical protein ONZ45_g18717 [Pleurotus djamor]